MGNKKYVITIDGPAAAGKTTAANALAKRLGFVHLNSGRLFRAVAWKCSINSVDLGDDRAVSSVAKGIQFSFVLDKDRTVLLVDGCDLGALLDSEEVGEGASKIGTLSALRETLKEVQRNIASRYSIVLEGRDAGTVIFPNADVKFFMVADATVRAQRRFSQVFGSQGELTEGQVERLRLQVKEDMERRDHRDQTRTVAPNEPAEEAIIIDTSHLGPDEVAALLERTVLSQIGQS